MSMQNLGGRRRGLIPEDLMKFRWLDEIAISPNGAQIAYTIRRPDAASNGYISHLYLRPLDADSPIRLTQSDGQASSIAWSRDGARLAYSYRGDSGDSVRVIALKDKSETCYPTDGQSIDQPRLVSRWKQAGRCALDSHENRR